jgi:flagellar basal body-associated protein FliL
MSESTGAETPPAEAPAPAKGGGGNKLVTILAILNFVAVLGLGGYFFYMQQHAAAQGKKDEPAEGGEGHGEKKEAGHGEKKEAGHGEKKEAGHGEKKEGGHGEEKEAGHGEKKEGGHGEAKEEHGAEGESHGDEHAGEGPLLALESMVTNLSEPDSDRYLKVVLQFRLTSEAAKPEVEAYLVPVRNQILIFLSSLTMEDTVGAENKRALQKRVKRIANEAMPSSRITEVYFTEFVIQ